MSKSFRPIASPALNGVLSIALIATLWSPAARAEETKAALTFSGGHNTEPKDHGRPVTLVAAGLGVKPEVFREAFSGVTPARDGKPSGEEAQRNKESLLKVLKPHGVTNERLDEVSDYYRYQPQKGKLWKTTPAKAHAIIEDGKIKKIIVTEPGSGYSTPPDVTIEGFAKTPLKVTLEFSTALKKNGGIKSIEVVPADVPKSVP
jgi:hypothetical protein